MSLDLLETYYLVGGTALSLQLGHRLSVDLDLFGKLKFDYDALINACKQIGEVTDARNYTNNSDPQSTTTLIQLNLNGVKIDILQYNEILIKPIIKYESLRLASIEDIAAMKVRAIEDRGARKDFYDLYSLLDHFSLKQILEFSKIKYAYKSPLFSVQCMLDFSEADSENDPKSLINISWDVVKSRVSQEAQKFLL
jgi:predicted nucleotidyltransferase component of viral defense system